jgi:hypothetical protein
VALGFLILGGLPDHPGRFLAWFSLSLALIIASRISYHMRPPVVTRLKRQLRRQRPLAPGEWLWSEAEYQTARLPFVQRFVSR